MIYIILFISDFHSVSPTTSTGHRSGSPLRHRYVYYNIIICTGRTGVRACRYYFIPSRRKVCAAVVIGESGARMKFRVVSYLI